MTLSTAAIDFLRSRHGKLSLAVLAFVSLCFLIPAGRVTSFNLHAQSPENKSLFHLLIPATSSNVNLCKLLLSASILGYPTPAFINWAAHEDEDAYKQHIAKVETTLKYMEGLNTTSSQDLVLIVDGYDVWFQLPPEVLLRRYYELNSVADALARERYGEENFMSRNMTQTVIFGPDKICWPVDYSRPACWAMPTGTLSQFAFGPETDIQLKEHRLARFLNSGTILGPLEDVREVFRATLKRIKENHTTDSDQFYFSNVYGDQEYTRLDSVPGMVEAKMNETFEAEHRDEEKAARDKPELEPGQKTEYHIGLDWRSELFQTIFQYKQVLTFTKYANAWKPADQEKLDMRQLRYAYELPKDLQEARPPFRHFNASQSDSHNKTWADVELMVNTATQTAPACLHIAGPDKAPTWLWWRKMWYYSEAKNLRKAALATEKGPISKQPIGGRTYWNAEASYVANRNGTFGHRDGGWSDKGKWLSWAQLCGEHEKEMYPPAAATSSARHAT